MWDLPGSGIEPMSPALQGKLFTTEPPGKPQSLFFFFNAPLDQFFPLHKQQFVPRLDLHSECRILSLVSQIPITGTRT